MSFTQSLRTYLYIEMTKAHLFKLILESERNPGSPRSLSSRHSQKKIELQVGLLYHFHTIDYSIHRRVNFIHTKYLFQFRSIMFPVRCTHEEQINPYIFLQNSSLLWPFFKPHSSFTQTRS